MMKIVISCVIILITTISNVTKCDFITNDHQVLLDMCMDSKYHKSSPSPEPNLKNLCKPYANRSCCTYNTTMTSHDSINHYKINYDMCSESTGHHISSSCKKWFIQDLCFIDCDPNLGPFIVPANSRTHSKHRVYKVPLCESECANWFQDCYLDYTCAYNWPRDLDWKSDKHQTTCKQNHDCRKFSEIYSSPKDFCESVWDNSFKVVSNNAPCYRIRLDYHYENPNSRAAKEWLQRANSSSKISPHSIFILMLINLVNM